MSVAWGAADALDPSQPLNAVYYPVGSTAGGLPGWTLGTIFMPRLLRAAQLCRRLNTVTVSALFDDGSRIDDTLHLFAAANRIAPWTRSGTDGVDLIVGGARNDTPDGRGGDDILLGGAGEDVLRGAGGNGGL